MLNHSKFIILGAGMAGLGAGVTLQRAKMNSLILEKKDKPGGLCITQSLRGCDFDYGPKLLLLDDSENSRELLSFLGKNYQKYPVEESVYLSRYGLVGFPLQRHLVDLPPNKRKKILEDLESASQNPRDVNSFKDWLINSYGEYFCKFILFPYEEKKWQTNLDQMEYQWALNRPIKVDKEEIIKGATTTLPPNRWYYYPKKGNIQVLSHTIAKLAGPICCHQEIQSINLTEKYLISSGQKYFYDYLISTLPLDYVVNITSPMPMQLKQKAEKLLQRLGIVVINLVFRGERHLKGTAIYFPEKEFIFRRVSVLPNLCPALSQKGLISISVEISINPKHKLSNGEMFTETMKGFTKIEQFAKLGQPLDCQFLEIGFAYPLQVNGLSDFIEELHRYYSSYHIYHCGRGGNFNYCNLDKAYKQGVETAQRVLLQNPIKTDQDE